MIQSHKELYSSIKNEVSDTLLEVPGCHACQLKEVTVPGCESLASQRKKRGVENGVEVLFSLVIKSEDDGNVEEKSEAVLFQMQYAVAAGKFIITLHGINTTADRSSFRHVFSIVKCGAGFVMASDGKGCGTYCPF